MKTIKYFSIIIFLSLLFFSCSKMDDIYLTDSVFIEDTNHQGLPIYSEWGYNTFGAYIDKKVFVSVSDEMPAKIFVYNDTMHLMLKGIMNNVSTSLTFSIKGPSPTSEYDLLDLDNTIFDLKEAGRAVKLAIGNDTLDLHIIEGDLHINKVQRLYIDEVSTRAIMSGYFKLKTFLNGEPTAITYGRFDLGIGYENFYNFTL